AEGLFIAYRPTTTEMLVRPGQQVMVSGTVSEAQQLTQLQQVTQLSVCGTVAQPKPVTLSLPVADTTDFESYEGMLVATTSSLIVNGNYQLARHGQFQVAPERLYSPTQRVKPGAEAQQIADLNNRSLITIDDNQAPNPMFVPYPAPRLTATNSLRAGTQIEAVTGVFSEFNNDYRIQPTQPIIVSKLAERPAAPPEPAAQTIRVSAFNVLNYFNGEGTEKSFPTERGAENLPQFMLQQAKIVAALASMDAHIIGLMEIENDGYDSTSAIVQLTEALRTKTGKPWAFIRATETGAFGTDQITNGLLYRTDKVRPEGDVITITEYPFGARSRYPLIQQFTPTHNQESFLVAVNHFKSKGSCPRGNDPANQNNADGQACWNGVRVQSAQLLADFIENDPRTASIEARVLLGDFNAYAQEDPIQLLLQRGYHNRIDVFEPNGYSYVFSGQAGSLDHLLVSTTLHNRIVRQHHWSINADEPTALQYNQAIDNPDWASESPFRSSDHDPVYADIQF
ncbi:MAG TPA: ExeM/NucH family extracellular endonuclease, partial [Pseudidiomarina sp.]|nr:ExeM/NucH family extracellular endonuclease [Pseudidiomarina sp.]